MKFLVLAERLRILKLTHIISLITTINLSSYLRGKINIVILSHNTCESNLLNNVEEKKTFNSHHGIFVIIFI